MSGAREHALPRQDLGVLDALRELALVLGREQFVLRELTEVRREMIIGVRRTHRLRRCAHRRLHHDRDRRSGERERAHCVTSIGAAERF